jgi:molecular chaperone GrpE
MNDEMAPESVDGISPQMVEDCEPNGIENRTNPEDEANIDGGTSSDPTTFSQKDVEIIDRLAQWLTDVRSSADETAAAATEIASPTDGDAIDEPGLLRLVEEFTALRQDVKLQAKSARGLQDQTESLLAGLTHAIEQFQSIVPREEQAVRDALKPVLESLTDLDASLERGRVAAESAHANLTDESGDAWRKFIETESQGMPFWKRFCLSVVSNDLSSALQSRLTQEWSTTLQAQVEGYRLIQNRLRRILQQQQIERIECIGKPVDPNQMTVIDVAEHDNLPAGTVLEELRPGYLWRGRLLRYAEVRVVRSRTSIEFNDALS